MQSGLSVAPSVRSREILSLRIAVLIPCYNEAVTITDVVTGFRASLPGADIYVYDNNSKDGTADRARDAGAIVRSETRQGKGHVVRRMFADVEADVYVMVDGDGTYDAAAAAMLVQRLVDDRLDMMVGARVADAKAAYRAGHRTGNRLITGTITRLFGRAFDDILSGYRVFSRRFVKSFPALSGGFEIETELTIHALQLAMPVAETPLPYVERPEGSVSKLSTWGDGFRILRTILVLLKDEKPFLFFGAIGAAMTALSLIAGTPVILEFLRTGLVPRFPTAILATGMMVIAVLCVFAGAILDSVARGRRESKRLFYLGFPAVNS
jgi:glycosyltransferase involved in cell wall biosynthesis